ncbi:hypothetical protein AYK61_04690 [Rhodococcus sp. SBT000017]|uniref:AAA family ATPase n=1 Tax=Rhodococcus sp. SBT000017 TaxID=1803385 RepID=UPI000EF859D3|nr:AAA family ATPase [Rhodococcus sp. SBT000017]RMB75973.1 hypothetical protein AYK61_04690 [Rhodococcus sp. SBT000017]
MNTFSERADKRAGSLERRAEQWESGDELSATRAAQATAERIHNRSMLDAFLTDRVAVFAPDNGMAEFLSILPDAEDVVNSALNSGRMWTDEDGEGDRDVLFFRVDDDTRLLLAPEHLAEHPGVRVFASDPGLRLDHQFDQFAAAGLDLDDFTPLVEVETAETEAAERFYAAPQAFSSVDMSVLMWNWSRLSANDIRAEAARLDACETDAEAFAELTRQFHGAKAHELACERDNPPDDNPEDTMTEDEYDGPCALDLARLRSEPRPPKVWLETGVVAEKSVTKFVAGSGDGKTILIADMAIHHSLGLSALDRGDDGRPRQLDGGPKRVLYIDGEVGEDWWLDYLERFAAPAELPNLFVVSMEDIPALTTDAGVVAMTKLIERYRPDVVVIDTLSSYIEGAENDSDTWIAFDNRITLPLKAKGVTVIYADHTGKNPELGARGSSAKRAKLDAEWLLSKPRADRKNELRLSRLKDRTGSLPEKVALKRVDGPLAHVRITEGKLTLKVVAGREVPEDDKVAAIVEQLDQWDVSVKTGRPSIAARLRDAGFTAPDAAIRLAIDHRRSRPQK